MDLLEGLLSNLPKQAHHLLRTMLLSSCYSRLLSYQFVSSTLVQKQPGIPRGGPDLTRWRSMRRFDIVRRPTMRATSRLARLKSISIARTVPCFPDWTPN